MGALLVSYALTRQLSQFVAAIVFFHVSEYVLAVNIHGKSNVTLSSLLISKQYILAMGGACLEYFIEIFLFPEIKQLWLISNVGLALVLVGEVIRKFAVITAQRAFTHHIKVYREQHHQLVTHGIYRFIRHPGYCGFFMWATGTQLMICNPICIVLFTVVSWRHFASRIPYPFFFYNLNCDCYSVSDFCIQDGFIVCLIKFFIFKFGSNQTSTVFALLTKGTGFAVKPKHTLLVGHLADA